MIKKRIVSSDKITSYPYGYKGKKNDQWEYLDQIIFKGIGGNI